MHKLKAAQRHVIFLVDEIGQYIADDTQLMLNLQTIVEDLGTACKGKAISRFTQERGKRIDLPQE